MKKWIKIGNNLYFKNIDYYKHTIDQIIIYTMSEIATRNNTEYYYDVGRFLIDMSMKLKSKEGKIIIKELIKNKISPIDYFEREGKLFNEYLLNIKKSPLD